MRKWLISIFLEIRSLSKEIWPLIVKTTKWFNWLKVSKTIFHFQRCKHVSVWTAWCYSSYFSWWEAVSLSRRTMRLQEPLRSRGTGLRSEIPGTEDCFLSPEILIKNWLLLWHKSWPPTYCSFISQSAGNGREWERWGDKLSYIAINSAFNGIGNTPDIDTGGVERS